MLYEPDYLLWEDALREDVCLNVDDKGFIVGVVRKDNASGALRLPGKLVLPGTVNVHSHAFQRLIRGRTEYVGPHATMDDFWSWRTNMYRSALALTPEDLFVVSRQAFMEMARAGITAVGEFHYLHRAPDGSSYEDPNLLAKQVIAAARSVGMRICLLRVAYARSGFERPVNSDQRRFIEPNAEVALRAADDLEQGLTDSLVTVGLAPHSIRAVPKSWLELFAAERQRPVHMHVAEQIKEVEACLAEYGRRPVELLEGLGMLGPHFTAIHAVHVHPKEIESLGKTRSNVCACPSTERNLGDGILAADEMIKAGVQLSFGSDSQTHISMLTEARLLEGHLRLAKQRRAVMDPGGGHPSGLALRLFAQASWGGARSLGLSTGMLSPNLPADFFTVDLNHSSIVGADAETLLSSVVFGADPGAIRDVAVQGRFIVRDGRHPLEDEIGVAFRHLSRRVFS